MRKIDEKNGNIIKRLGIDEKVQDEKVKEFKDVISDESNSLEEIIDKYLLFGTSYFLKDNEKDFYEFKTEVARYFNVSPTKIFVVGSAKLGFSIAPGKEYRHFNEESDIDIAIIDSEAFLGYWKKLYEYNTIGRAWSSDEKEIYEKFLKCFFKGWLRPDKFPRNMDEKQKWFDFMKLLQGKYQHKIAAGIYYDFDVFKLYNRENLSNIRLNSKREGTKNG